MEHLSGDISDFVRSLKNKGSDLDTNSTFTNPRKLIKNIKEIHESGKYPNIETDVFKILDAYSRSMSKAIAGKNITALTKQKGKVRPPPTTFFFYIDKIYEQQRKNTERNMSPITDNNVKYQ